jgi:hypothetical protein
MEVRPPGALAETSTVHTSNVEAGASEGGENAVVGPAVGASPRLERSRKTAEAVGRDDVVLTGREEVWGFLWAPLTEQYWWWKIVVHNTRKLVVAAILTLIDARSIYMPVSTFVLLLVLVILQIHLRPFAAHLQNVVDVGVLATACALYFTFILANTDRNAARDSAASILQVADWLQSAVSFALVCCVAGGPLHELWRRMRAL